MPPPAYTRAMRRTKRLQLSISVIVRGRALDGLPVRELTHTLSINGHGAVVALAACVAEGQTLTIENPIAARCGTARSCGLYRGNRTKLPWHWSSQTSRSVSGRYIFPHTQLASF